MPTRDFPLADILSLTTGRLLSHRHMDGVYDLAEHMTGGPVWTHQLPRATDACKPALLEQHPHLDGVEPPDDIDVPDLKAWLVGMEAEHGRDLPVAPLPDGVWERRDPVAELAATVGPDRVIPVIVSGRDRTPKAG